MIDKDIKIAIIDQTKNPKEKGPGLTEDVMKLRQQLADDTDLGCVDYLLLCSLLIISKIPSLPPLSHFQYLIAIATTPSDYPSISNTHFPAPQYKITAHPVPPTLPAFVAPPPPKGHTSVVRPMDVLLQSASEPMLNILDDQYCVLEPIFKLIDPYFHTYQSDFPLTLRNLLMKEG
ncbi:hypothetical protein HAX54_050245 [Datura stramonium]|uniref:Uncharacterized protein n=1 Tax=Datura stramonium TaxID=4076 RepID=A0ABS8SY57_DATST|nr:hypothetical protein [Datura stramonium]